jgi:hypothetical protein
MQNEQPAASAPVVPNIKIPKLHTPQGLLATINAFSIAFATFFSVNSIFGAIANFTKGEWTFSIPVIGQFSVVKDSSTLFMTAFIAVVFALVGLLTLKKITDAEILKKAYTKISSFFAIISVILTSIAAGTIIYALLALGEKSGVDQGDLWLSGFLPALILAATSVAVTVLTAKIASGKTALLRVLSLIALCVAAVGFILVVISTLVNFYAEKSSPYQKEYDIFKNILNY